MYIEGSGVTTKQFLRAWFVSESQQPTGAACVQFWYHMYGFGDPVGSLNLYVQVKYPSNVSVWYKNILSSQLLSLF